MKRIALIGAKEGPWCSITWIKNPVLRVNGMEKGRLNIELMCKGSPTPLLSETHQNGDVDLNALSQVFADSGLEWIRVSSSHPSNSLICVVVPKKAA